LTRRTRVSLCYCTLNFIGLQSCAGVPDGAGDSSSGRGTLRTVRTGSRLARGLRSAPSSQAEVSLRARKKTEERIERIRRFDLLAVLSWLCLADGLALASVLLVSFHAQALRPRSTSCLTHLMHTTLLRSRLSGAVVACLALQTIQLLHRRVLIVASLTNTGALTYQPSCIRPGGTLVLHGGPLVFIVRILQALDNVVRVTWHSIEPPGAEVVDWTGMTIPVVFMGCIDPVHAGWTPAVLDAAAGSSTRKRRRACENKIFLLRTELPLLAGSARGAVGSVEQVVPRDANRYHGEVIVIAEIRRRRDV